nr:GntR family transcriptional regulator [uncultured Oscillibacter sp.]
MDIHLMAKPNLSSTVKNYLYQYIRQIYLKGEEKLSPENVISTNLGVSRVTVRRALGDLEKEGVIIRIHGRGTFINPEAVTIQANLMPGEEFSHLIKSCGYTPSIEVISLSREMPSPVCLRTLRLTADTEVFRVEKLYLADGHPAIISVDYFSCNLVNGELEREALEKESVFHLLRSRTGHLVARDKISMEAISKETAAKIIPSAHRLENNSLLFFQGINYNQENIPIIFDYELYDTNFIKFGLLRMKDVYGD